MPQNFTDVTGYTSDEVPNLVTWNDTDFLLFVDSSVTVGVNLRKILKTDFEQSLNLPPSANLISIVDVAASRTLQLSDAGVYLIVDSPNLVQLTVPLHSSIAIPINSSITIVRYGLGDVEIVTSGPVLNMAPGFTNFIDLQYQQVTLTKRADDEWLLIGNLRSV